MSQKDNPAERLYRLLTAARQADKVHVRQVLSNILGVPEEPVDEFVEAVVQFHRLFDDVIGCLERIGEDDEEIYVKPIRRMRGAFPLLALDSGWNHFLPRLSDVDMVSLRHAVHVLRNQPFPPPVEKAVLDQLLEDVSALYDLVDEAGPEDVPEVLRAVILKGLWAILKAIRETPARGNVPLHDALLFNAGAIVTYYPMFEQFEQNEKVSAYRATVQKLRTMLPITADVVSLLGPAIQGVLLLLSGGK
jgi:hypothetical protein